MMKLLIALILIFSLTLVTAAESLHEIIFWHAMAGNLAGEVKKLAQDFNQSQQKYKIIPIYKGNYIELLASFAAAFRAGQAPPLVQIYGAGTHTMLKPAGIIEPVEDIMQSYGHKLDKQAMFPAILNFYSMNNKLVALPFNASVPIIYYNKAAIADVGYTDKNFPQTWQELEILAQKLKQKGFKCVYTSAYPSWIIMEGYISLHGLGMFDGDEKPAYALPELITHLERLKRWQKLGYFEYGGRTDHSILLFTSGRCPIFSQSSGNYNGLLQLVNFPLGVASLPVDKNITKNTYANVIGGGAIWVVAGQTSETKKGIAAFFNYLLSPPVQRNWFLSTGYLPIGIRHIYKDNEWQQYPLLAIAEPTLNAKIKQPLLRYDAQNQIQTINDEALEAIFANILSPKAALNDAVNRAIKVSQRFHKNTATSPHNG